MQAIVETIFDIAYLSTVLYLGFIMIRKAKKQSMLMLFGIMTLLLGFGDAFHLIPRLYALLTTGLTDYPIALGIGKLITSITMTFFYVILYLIWKKRYLIPRNTLLDYTIYTLASLRIVLCLFPQNEWTSLDGNITWGITRNIPFLLMGIIITYLYYTSQKAKKDTTFRFMWLAITLSFAFYIPVVLFSKTYPLIGMLMIPKTLMYVWIVLIGYRTRNENNS